MSSKPAAEQLEPERLLGVKVGGRDAPDDRLVLLILSALPTVHLQQVMLQEMIQLHGRQKHQHETEHDGWTNIYTTNQKPRII